MIIVCEKCSSRLQVDDKKVTSRAFSFRCPKCNHNIESPSTNPAVEKSAIAVGSSPSSSSPRHVLTKPAPLFEPGPVRQDADNSGASVSKLAEVLAGLVSQPMANAHSASARPSWNPRKALVCVTEENREMIGRGLVNNGYQVFVAEDTRQAIERMRENQLDVVLIDQRFDPVEQGAVFVTREVNIQRPAQRRRVFFILLSTSLRTMDAHAAFLNNVNAVVNVADISDLPPLIDHRLREYNELYKSFNLALKTPPL